MFIERPLRLNMKQETLYNTKIETRPTTAQRCRSETEKNILEDLFSPVLSKLKKYHPFWKPES